jgi:hypothetical protein
MEILTIFMAYPLAAWLVFAAFAVLCGVKRRILPGVAATLWAAYGYYEYLMHTRVLCTGECNIRIDLLLIYPLLLLISVWATASSLKRTRT